MPLIRLFFAVSLGLTSFLPAGQAALEKSVEGDADKGERVEIVVSVADQKLALVRNGEVERTYAISTSRFGLGDSYGSYRTPLGRLKISRKIGDGVAAGTVFKHRVPTGEVLPPNAPGRDPIVSRILWLDGLESDNRNAYGRCVYIHGTPDEKRLGRPVSYGCIRMRSADVIALYCATPVGTEVSIVKGRLPHGGGFFEMIASAAAPAIRALKL